MPTDKEIAALVEALEPFAAADEHQEAMAKRLGFKDGNAAVRIPREHLRRARAALATLTTPSDRASGQGEAWQGIAAGVWRQAYIAVYGCEPTHPKEAYQAAYDVISAALTPPSDVVPGEQERGE